MWQHDKHAYQDTQEPQPRACLLRCQAAGIVGGLLFKIVAGTHIILSQICHRRASELEVHRALADNIIAHVLARLHHALRDGLVVAAREVGGAAHDRVAFAVESRTHPAFVGNCAVVTCPDAAVVLAAVDAERALKIGVDLNGK